MRERNSGNKQKKTKSFSGSVRVISEESDSPEVRELKEQIRALETENQRLRQQVNELSKQSSIREPSYDEKLREQRHNFFKYSNLRRY